MKKRSKMGLKTALVSAMMCCQCAFATPTTIDDPNLLDYSFGKWNSYEPDDLEMVCYKPLYSIAHYKDGGNAKLNIENEAYHIKVDNESKFDLTDLKQLELFDEFKVAKQIAEKLDAKNTQTNEQLDSMIKDFTTKFANKQDEGVKQYEKLKEIALKMGCVTKDKVKDFEPNDRRDEVLRVNVTFPHSLKEVYTEMLKALK